MSQLKLQTKLIIAFLIIALVVLAQGITTFQSTQETTGNFETIVERSSPAINALDQMKAAEASMVQEVFSFGLKRRLGILTGVSMADNQEIKRFQDNWRLMEEGQTVFQETSTLVDGAEEISMLRQKALMVYQAGLNYLTLSTQVDDIEILSPAHENLEIADHEFEVVLQTLLQSESDRLTELSEISNSSVRRGLLLNAVTSLALIIFIIGIGFIVVQTVANPVRKLESAVRNIARGDYSQRIDVKSGDEVGQLTIAVNGMADAIQIRDRELSQLNTMLEQRVIETRDSRDQAERANQAKSIFLSNMSHELRTPLNMVIGYTSSMLTMPQMYNGQTLPEVFRNDIELIQQNGEHLLSLINDLLDLSKIEAGKLELQRTAVDLAPIFKGVIASSLGLVGEKPVQVRLNSPDELPQVWADALRVRQILLNLMSNAIKFTKTGSVTLSAKVEKDQLYISVQDTGIGISQASISTIFDRFQQVQQNSNIQGTGLGLDISQQLANLHGSEITIESVMGQGSTFAFELPLATDEQIAQPQAILELTSSNTAIFDDVHIDLELSHTILVVEDDSDTRDMLHRILENDNHAVIDAHDGKLALELARNLLPDMIVLDIQLGEMDGWSFLEALQAYPETQSIPVIVVTVSPDATRAQNLGVKFMLEKPIHPRELLDSINAIFNSHEVEMEGE